MKPFRHSLVWFCTWPWFTWFCEAVIPCGLDFNDCMRAWFHDSVHGLDFRDSMRPCLFEAVVPWFLASMIPYVAVISWGLDSMSTLLCTCLYCWVGLRSSPSLVLYHSLQSLIWDLIGTFPGSWVKNVMKGNRCDGVENIKCWDEQDAQYFEGAFCISSTNTALSVQPHKVPLSAGQAPVGAKLRETFI